MTADESRIEWTHNYGCPQDLADIDTDDLVYVILESVSDEALMAEQERCQEMQQLNDEAYGNIDPDEWREAEEKWVDRVVVVEDMRHHKTHGFGFNPSCPPGHDPSAWEAGYGIPLREGE